MSYMSVGNCAKCGAPIYTESPWFATTPPPSRHSCNCFAVEAMRGAGSLIYNIITTANTTANASIGYLPIAVPQQTSKEH